MISLASVYGRSTRSLREIAQLEELSEGYLEQLIVSLRKAGLVRARRGARGGYELSRSPSAISLFDILRALENGNICPDCVKDPCVCARSANCATRPVWVHFESKIWDIASSMNLENMCALPDADNETAQTVSA